MSAKRIEAAGPLPSASDWPGIPEQPVSPFLYHTDLCLLAVIYFPLFLLAIVSMALGHAG